MQALSINSSTAQRAIGDIGVADKEAIAALGKIIDLNKESRDYIPVGLPQEADTALRKADPTWMP
jgi:hypothetical protein